MFGILLGFRISLLVLLVFFNVIFVVMIGFGMVSWFYFLSFF